MNDDYYDASDAADCANDYARNNAIEECMKDPNFVWRWRIVSKCKNFKKIKHLSKWCEDYISDILFEKADAADERRDPLGYRGLRASDFYKPNRALTLKY